SRHALQQRRAGNLVAQGVRNRDYSGSANDDLVRVAALRAVPGDAGADCHALHSVAQRGNAAGALDSGDDRRCPPVGSPAFVHVAEVDSGNRDVDGSHQTRAYPASSGRAQPGLAVVDSEPFGPLVLGDDALDDLLDLALGPAVADELLDQDQVALAHAPTVAAGPASPRHRCGNQVDRTVWPLRPHAPRAQSRSALRDRGEPPPAPRVPTRRTETRPGSRLRSAPRSGTRSAAAG